MGELCPADRKLDKRAVVDAFRTSPRRLLLLDYDGTLTPLVGDPSQALPSEELVEALRLLHGSSKNIEYIVTGRDRDFVERHLASRLGGVGFACEHGSLLRPHVLPGNELPPWENLADRLDLSWRDPVRRAADDVHNRTPGSRLEVKQIAVAWHYREVADPAVAELAKKDLLARWNALAQQYDIDVLEGNKVVEVRPRGFTKGSIARSILKKSGPVDFILCLGDDTTDQDMFNEINEDCVSCKKFTVSVRALQRGATFCMDTTEDVVALLQELAKIS